MATQAVVDLEYGRGNPDPRALAVAGGLQARLPGTQVLLFGSRATGTWRPESDLDLAVIGGDRDAAEEALAQLQDRERDLYADAIPYPQIFHFSQAEFDELRTALTHVAGQVQKYGIRPNGESLPAMPQNEPWKGIRTRMQSSCRHYERALRNLGAEDPEGAIHNAEMAVELMLKAAVGTAARDVGNIPRKHPLQPLVERLPQAQAAWINELLPPRLLGQLSNFRQAAAYEGDLDIPWPSIDADRLTDKVGKVCGRLAAEILVVMDKQPHDVGYGKMLAELPFGGWESLPLDHYSQAATENRDHVSLMRTLLTGVVAERDIALIADDWTTRGAPSRVPERLKAVLANPDTWRSLFVHSEARERDADRSRVWRDRPPPKGW